jgi:hypothetical protein
LAEGLSCGAFERRPIPLSENGQPILEGSEVVERKALLAELGAALDESGIECRLAGRRRLVLRYTEQPPHAPSGLIDPVLFVFGPAPDAVTTDGDFFRLRDGQELPVGDLAAVVAAIGGVLESTTRP